MAPHLKPSPTKTKARVPHSPSGQTVNSASFRDPAGYVYTRGNQLFRRISATGRPDFEQATANGLYKTLIEADLLVAHRPAGAAAKDGSIDIKPDVVPVITYPFEWSFSMLQDAALVTLRIQKLALGHDMSLKDATAYNIQFMGGKPLLIDTLSFEPYREGEPWVAYGQFCRHFLAPLALMAHADIRLQQLLREFVDGIPLDLAANLLPRKTLLRPGLTMHLRLHARSTASHSSDHAKPSANVSRRNLLAILDSLERTVSGLKLPRTKTEWGDYYDHTNYSDSAATAKAKLIQAFAKDVPKLKRVLDLGGNDGRYSRPFLAQNVDAVCADIDPLAVEANYRTVKKHHETHMLPLLIDLINPGGAMGWGNRERTPVHERLQADAVMALALIHHLAISNNVPFGMIAEYLKQFGPYLVIEYVPKTDSQVQKLLATRKDVFGQYTQQDFEAAFAGHYRLVRSQPIRGSKRMLYLYKRR